MTLTTWLCLSINKRSLYSSMTFMECLADIVDAKNPQMDRTLDGMLGSVFKFYATIKVQQVACSNKWYHCWTVGQEYENNLQLSFDFLQCNTSDVLWEKCLEAHNLYPLEQQGCHPLFFNTIMMKKIQCNTQNAVCYLQESIKKMKLTHFHGKNVYCMVSLLHGAEHHLKNMPLGSPWRLNKVLDH